MTDECWCMINRVSCSKAKIFLGRCIYWISNITSQWPNRQGVVDNQNDPGLTAGLKGELHRLPSSLPVTHWLMSLATPTFKPSVSWDQSNRIQFKEARWLLYKDSGTHDTVIHTFSAVTEGPLWFQASPASNRFLLEATGSETPVSSDATWLPDLLSFEHTWKKYGSNIWLL